MYGSRSTALLARDWITFAPAHAITIRRAENLLAPAMFNWIFKARANAQQVANSKFGQPIAPSIVHAETRGLSFNRDSGDAWTDQPVALTFPGGNGTATGVNYTSGEGVINLLHDVRFHLQSAMPGFSGKHPAKTAKPADVAKPGAAQNLAAPVDLSASSLEFQRDTGIIFMRGPVVALQSPPSSHRELHASELRVELDTEMRAKQISARGTTNAAAELFSRTPKEEVRIAAENLSAEFRARRLDEALSR